MSQLLISQYFNEIDLLKKTTGSKTEGVVSEAFKDLLKAWSKQKDLVFSAQYSFQSPQKTLIRPDGTIFHSLGVPFGYWEAKDTNDDLDAEIASKTKKGYPRDNIIYENSDIAVLFQNTVEVMRCSMQDNKELERLLVLFFSYERTEIREFRKAIEQFKTDLPFVLEELRKRINDAYASNKDFKVAAIKFLDHARDTINPSLTEADVREMLIQHILTEEIFANVFNDSDFHKENNIAKELYALEGKFFTGGVKKETLAGLAPYYTAIKSNAAQIGSHGEKQTFLKVIYENFYKVYNPKAADRLGVVYTPNEIVKFMIQGTDWLCEKHFGKRLIDKGVEILDPATGTGTFICELLEHFRGEGEKLAYKYKNELHANEVAILPYYVANLNIEATYAAITGQYAEFPNLCFVDTLDNVAGLGIKTGHHMGDLFGALSTENVERVKRQNSRKISVIIGNPPYNANQANENDENKNRGYKFVDIRIKETFIALSTAQKTKQYDMFVRFVRWAADRLTEGMLVYIVNRKFIDGRNFDGFRKSVLKEFDEAYVIDLGGDYKEQGVGGGGNVFGIGTGVAILIFVKKVRKAEVFNRKGALFYVSTGVVSSSDKLSWISSTPLQTMKFDRVKSDNEGYWINKIETEYETGIPIAAKEVKQEKLGSVGEALFQLYSLGIATNRDDWVYDHSKEALVEKIDFFTATYNACVEGYIASSGEAALLINRTIKWTSELEALARKSKKLIATAARVRRAMYRPFNKIMAYYDRSIVHRLYVQDLIFPIESHKENRVVVFTGPNSQKPWLVFCSEVVADLHLVGSGAGTVCMPRYRYTKSGERLDNITDWGLNQFTQHYGKAANLTKDAIFNYVYGVLHDPIYRETYAINLKRDFPRVPFYPDFHQWAAWGEALMGLHIGYETVAPWPLERTDVKDVKAAAVGQSPKPFLKAIKEKGAIVLDSETTLAGIPPEAWTYKLGNRSGLEWVLDQHKEKTPKDKTIREKFNTYRFADYKEKVVDLLMRVTRVSVETMAIVEAMKAAKR
jgi:predicted helicase